jgi:hypothetical protein
MWKYYTIAEPYKSGEDKLMRVVMHGRGRKLLTLDFA